MCAGELLHQIQKATPLNTEIYKRLLEENISISYQALTCARKGMVTVLLLPVSQYPGRYRYIYLQSFNP